MAPWTLYTDAIIRRDDAFVQNAGNMNLIIITSSFGKPACLAACAMSTNSAPAGVVFLAFIGYVVLRLYRGHHIADILKLRRTTHNIYDEMSEAAVQNDGPPFIQMTQRYSVRSYRNSMRWSLYSSKSRRTAKSRPPASPLPSPLSPAFSRGFGSDDRSRATRVRRPPPIHIPTEPMPKITTAWLASPKSTLVESIKEGAVKEYYIDKPGTGYSKKSSPGVNKLPVSPIEFEALPQLSSQDASQSRRITVTTRAVDGEKALPAPWKTDPTRELRWSSAGSELPPTPKLALGRFQTTDDQPSQLRVEHVKRDGERMPTSKPVPPNEHRLTRLVPAFTKPNGQNRESRRVLTRTRSKREG